MQAFKLSSNNSQEKLQARQALKLCNAAPASTQDQLEARQALKWEALKLCSTVLASTQKKLQTGQAHKLCSAVLASSHEKVARHLFSAAVASTQKKVCAGHTQQLCSAVPVCSTSGGVAGQAGPSCAVQCRSAPNVACEAQAACSPCLAPALTPQAPAGHFMPAPKAACKAQAVCSPLLAPALTQQAPATAALNAKWLPLSCGTYLAPDHPVQRIPLQGLSLVDVSYPLAQVELCLGLAAHAVDLDERCAVVLVPEASAGSELAAFSIRPVELP